MLMLFELLQQIIDKEHIIINMTKCFFIISNIFLAGVHYYHPCHDRHDYRDCRVRHDHHVYHVHHRFSEVLPVLVQALPNLPVWAIMLCAKV